MAFTYDITQASARDQVRGLIGDKFADSALLQDEEIDAILTRQGNNVIYAAIEAAEQGIAALAQQADYGMKDSFLRASQRSAALQRVLENLRNRSLGFALPLADLPDDCFFKRDLFGEDEDETFCETGLCGDDRC